MLQIFRGCILFVVFCIYNSQVIAQLTPYELNGKNYTATYQECIAFYQNLDREYRTVSMNEMGITDGGKPLHIVTLSKDKKHDPAKWHNDGKVVVLINNGIHPGEPDGIDACMMMVRDYAKKIEEDGNFPDNIALAIIPIYNIDGALLRNEFHRVDQNGPTSFGERGNAQNLDLNRDFIKCDSKEALSFNEIFHWVNPDIFIDNHVSDGADYPYVMTLATSQHNKLGGVMGKYLHEYFEPSLFQAMKNANNEMIPYVNVWGYDAKEGWTQFFDSPRYSSGYATLWNSFAFTIETHMLKPYQPRVESTYRLMQEIISFSASNADTIKSLRAQTIIEQQKQKIFPLSWVNDKDKFTKISFNGYTYKTKISDVSNLPVKEYDRKDVYRDSVKFYNTFKPAIEAEAPGAYIIPQGYWRVIERLKANEVTMIPFESDQEMNVEVYSISSYESSATPYEGHHANVNTTVTKSRQSINIRAGDFYIPLNQDAKRFLIEVLEPQGMDSYFTWNFFDAILIQKEGYSDYAYEQYAAEYLKEHPEARIKLQEKRDTDTAFAKNAAAQLNFVYWHSPYHEERFQRYPVFRVLDERQSNIPKLIYDRPSLKTNKEDE